ncbi:tyrosyl-DNA phosphodiesterase 1-like [Amphibalanus amphitrite]|uniref:tyrosyl-DNA phosphodiesterase 1-like n=1 Tax=Amphibalanus amphitrite TaxID=1232801 RepID=UPI001C90BC0F|nr:tyrosyl-DNA phosphodiesterase 1-like [Amphibalanus amphitrite]XP_043233963.1 tyrosyl-DNA phosphodiesterase 1-like [Amphibalanus amphitrite]XP_043233964.1 tyrosyl-DNA phosphodiesterase 1-like [Amphibalanus amphitrite]
MSADLDELVARELQRQYEAEEKQRLADEAASERLAQKLATGSHTMSDDSEGSDSGGRAPSVDRNRILVTPVRQRTPSGDFSRTWATPARLLVPPGGCSRTTPLRQTPSGGCSRTTPIRQGCSQPLNTPVRQTPSDGRSRSPSIWRTPGQTTSASVSPRGESPAPASPQQPPAVAIQPQPPAMASKQQPPAPARQQQSPAPASPQQQPPAPARQQQQPPAPVRKQQQQHPAPASQQQPPAAAKQQQHPPAPASQQQPPAPAKQQQQQPPEPASQPQQQPPEPASQPQQQPPVTAATKRRASVLCAPGKRRALPSTLGEASAAATSSRGRGRGSAGRGRGAAAATSSTGRGRGSAAGRGKPAAGRAKPAAVGEQGATGNESAPAGVPVCPFGAKCYRTGNPEHMAALWHPGRPSGQAHQREAGGSAQNAGARNGAGASGQQPKPRCTIADRLREAEPMSFFLTKVRSVKSTWRERMAVGIAELLDPSLGELRSSLQVNYMVDLAWLLEAYTVHGYQDKPLTVLHGTNGLIDPGFPGIITHKVKMPMLWGTHHTKMMIFEYTEGMRVVIHTANLVESDWEDRTQGVWVSPLLPTLPAGAPDTAGESPTEFRAHLLYYLTHYQLDILTPWIERVRRTDFSAIRVFLVGSVPGRFVGPELNRWAHNRVYDLLNKHTPRCNWQLIVQCSSIGALGEVPHEYLLDEFSFYMSGGLRNVPVAVIFPCEEDVRTSLEGYEAGSCLPYRWGQDNKQRWLYEFMCKWRSETRNRTRAMPHIKTYTQISPDGRKMAWFLLTSHNLSRSAWGVTQKQDKQMCSRSYELGVMFLPKFLGCEYLSVLTGDSVAPGGISLPYCVPLTAYQPGEQPWIIDKAHKKPDIFGTSLSKPTFG